MSHVVVAALAAALVAVWESKRSSVVACRDNSVIEGDDSSISFFHAVRSRCGELSQSHKIGVESWPYELLVIKLKGVKLSVKFLNRLETIIEFSFDERGVSGIRTANTKICVIEFDKVI